VAPERPQDVVPVGRGGSIGIRGPRHQPRSADHPLTRCPLPRADLSRPPLMQPSPGSREQRRALQPDLSGAGGAGTRLPALASTRPRSLPGSPRGARAATTTSSSTVTRSAAMSAATCPDRRSAASPAPTIATASARYSAATATAASIISAPASPCCSSSATASPMLGPGCSPSSRNAQAAAGSSCRYDHEKTARILAAASPPSRASRRLATSRCSAVSAASGSPGWPAARAAATPSASGSGA
jgi:hypothetical protein